MKPVVVSAIIIAALTGYVGQQSVHVPTQQRLRHLKAQLDEARSTHELRRQIAKSLDQLELLRQQLPDEASTSWLLREVTQRAEESGVQLQSILPQDRKDFRDGTQLSVHLQLSAGYHQLGKFVNALEQSRPLLWIEEFAISKTGQEVPQVRLVVSTLHVPPIKL